MKKNHSILYVYQRVNGSPQRSGVSPTCAFLDGLPDLRYPSHQSWSEPRCQQLKRQDIFQRLQFLTILNNVTAPVTQTRGVAGLRTFRIMTLLYTCHFCPDFVSARNSSTMFEQNKGRWWWQISINIINYPAFYAVGWLVELPFLP